MHLDDITKNLTLKERLDASNWFDKLRPIEQEKIVSVIDTLNFLELTLGDTVIPAKDMAIIAAGSSIDSHEYTDIDLFILLSPNIYQQAEELFSPTGWWESVTHYTGIAIEKLIPKDVEYKIYAKDDAISRINSVKIDRWDKSGDQLIRENRLMDGLGAVIELSLLYNLGDKRKKDDLICEDRYISPEDIIEINRTEGSKFLVLHRDYSIPNSS